MRLGSNEGGSTGTVHPPHAGARKTGIVLVALASLFGWGRMSAQSDTARQKLHTILTTDPTIDSIGINEKKSPVSLDNLAKIQKMRGEEENQGETITPGEKIGDKVGKTVDNIEEYIEKWGGGSLNKHIHSSRQTINNTHINKYLSTIGFIHQWSIEFPNLDKGATYKPETEVQIVRNGKSYGTPLTLGDMYSYAFSGLSLPEGEVVPYEVLETTIAFFKNLEAEEKAAMGKEMRVKKAKNTAHK